MKIGELAKAASTPTETIRYYEREGLLPGAGRTDSNYRVYGEAHANRLNFIRHCRSLDMTLDEIRALLRFKDQPEGDCSGVNDLLDEHIGHVARRIKELRALQIELKALRDQCGASTSSAACGILNELDNAARTPKPARRSAVAHVHGTHALGAAQRPRQ